MIHDDRNTSADWRCPKRLVMFGTAGIMLMLAASSFFTWRVSQQISKIVDSTVEVLTAAEQIEHYGTVLELSIKSVVATGDAGAAARYRSTQPQLRHTITALRRKLQLSTNKISAAEVDHADLALIAMEYEALELTARGRISEARTIIHSEHYKRLLQVYYDGIQKIEMRASQYIDEMKRGLETYLSALLVLCLVSYGLLLTAWLALVRRAHSWVGQLENERGKATQALAALNASRLELEQANKRLLEQVRIDPLTGLQSRGKFNQDLAEVLASATERGESYSLVMCDVDHFKQYNDTYGHPAGDEVLRAIAHAFISISRASDQIYRYGGEEFVLILRTASLEAGTVWAERYRAAVEAMRIPHRSSSTGAITVSMGVAQIEPGRPLSAEQWLRRADGALYEAKRRGRNQVGSGKLVAA